MSYNLNFNQNPTQPIMPNNNNNFQPYQTTQYFPQPQGSIYTIASSRDISNVPVGAGLSAAICLQEGIIYLKTIQNGSPMLVGYRLSPLEGSPVNNTTTATAQPQDSEVNKKILSTLEDYGARLEKLENQYKSKTTKGGVSEWQL